MQFRAVTNNLLFARMRELVQIVHYSLWLEIATARMTYVYRLVYARHELANIRVGCYL